MNLVRHRRRTLLLSIRHARRLRRGRKSLSLNRNNT
jgi:hypothetical protein